MDASFRCFGCDAQLAERTPYCPHCGVRLESGLTDAVWLADAQTKVYVRQRPRLFGVPPQDTTLVVGVAAAVGGIVLLALGVLLTGALLVVAGTLLLLVFAETFRRRPASAIAGGAAMAVGVVQAELGFAVTAGSTWLRSHGERARLLWHRSGLRRSRGTHLLTLGECVYRDDYEGAEAARSRLRALDDRIDATTEAIALLERCAAIRLRAARSWRVRRTAEARARADAGRPLHA